MFVQNNNNRCTLTDYFSSVDVTADYQQVDIRHYLFLSEEFRSVPEAKRAEASTVIMACLARLFSLAVLFGFVTAGLHKRTAPVFLEKWDALSLISRQKRSNADDEETKLPANLERECLEEICNYEEAREVFQDNYRTDIFWSVYIGKL